MNNKGFTLIELLAVIVILAIIALIATPTILNIVENSKKSTVITSAENLIKSAQYYFITANPRYGKIDVLNEKLDYEGRKPELGEVEIDENGKSRIYAYINGYCVTKEYGTSLYASKTDKEDCNWYGTDNYDNKKGTTFTLNNQSVKNYLIYGNSTQATRSGKNLFDENLLLESSKISKIPEGYKVGGYPVVLTSTDSLVKKLKETLKPNTSYTLTRKVSNYISAASGRIVIRSASGELARVDYGNGIKSITFTLTQEQIDSIEYIYIYGKNNPNETIFEYIQLEEGNTATTYEKYGAMPSPEYPSEIKSTGDLLTSSNCNNYGSDACNNIGKYVIQVKNTGKNLFDKSKARVFGGYISSGKLNSYQSLIDTTVTFVIDCKPNTTYTVSRQVMGKRFAVGTSLKEPNVDIEMTNSKIAYNDSSITITSGDNDAYLYVWFYNSQYDQEYTYQQLMDGIQIEEGASATSYEAYIEPVTTNIYLNEPLRKVGDYADYIDFENKKIVRNVVRRVFNGTELWSKNFDYGDYVSFYTESDVKAFKAINGLGYSNVAPVADWNKISGSNGNYWWQFFPMSYGMRINKLYLNDYDSATDKISVFTTWLKSNNVEVIQVLDTPIEESIDLPNIKLLKGNSELSINTLVKPSNVKLSLSKN